jgi:DNA repair protein RecN (Recombination protein N)
MLTELHIRNLGVIDSVTLQFGKGFTAFTGETGAGKTMIIEAINLLVGGRAEAGMVRHGCDEARVDGRFVDPVSDDEVILSRVIPADGRSRAYIDGAPATVGGLAEVGARLVDLHGQHAHQSLLGERAQRAALDTFGDIDLSDVASAKAELAEIDTALSALGGDEQSRNREIDLLRFQVREIDEAEIASPDEDEQLRREEDVLGDVTANREALSTVYALLGDEGAAGDLVGKAVAAVATRAVAESLADRLVALSAEVRDLAAEARGLSENLEDDPERLAEIGERRRLLRDLCRKYGPNLGDVVRFGTEASTRLAELESHGETVAALMGRKSEVVRRLAAAQKAVAKARRTAAPKLAKAVETRLRDLALPHAEIRIEVPESAADPAGDGVCILIAANPGNPPAPLSKVASGGELARVMLALRLVLTQAPPTLVFDEVDAGIGGSAAVAVGEALRAVSRNHQVFVVTHLAQVAACADVQVGIAKSVKQKETFVRAGVLDGDSRVEEIARMLSGGQAKASALQTARDMLSV